MESRNITCAIVGDSKVGKTCLISSYLKTGFRSEHISTDFFVAHRSTTQIEETSFKLTLWDSPGEKDCYRHVPASYPQTDVLLMCFSIDCRASFDHLRKKWDKEVRRNCPKAPKILVGTKLDLRSGGAYDTDFISKLEGLDLCGVIGAYRYIECSARTEENVKDVFDEAIFATLGRQTKVQEKKSKSPFPNLKPKKWKKNRSAGCERKMSSSKENIAAIDRRCVDQGIEPFGYTKPDVNLVAEGSDEYDVYNEIEVASTYIEPFQPPPQPVIPSALQSLAQSISTRPLQDAESNDQAARQYENLYQYLPANIVDRPPLPKRLAQITSAPDMVAYGAPDHILAERPSDVRTAGASPCSASAPVSNSQTTENPTESGTCQQETIEAATLSQDSSSLPEIDQKKTKEQAKRLAAEHAKLKLLVLGDEAVGKTCLLTMQAEGKCPFEYVPTETDDCLTMEVKIDTSTITIGLWDLSGSKDFDHMRPENYKLADVILVCFSIVSPSTFESVRTRWKPEVSRYCPNTPVILVGTKADLRDDQSMLEKLRTRKLAPISHAQGRKLAKDVGAKIYHECSALKKQGLQTIFDVALDFAIESQESSRAQASNQNDPYLSKPDASVEDDYYNDIIDDADNDVKDDSKDFDDDNYFDPVGSGNRTVEHSAAADTTTATLERKPVVPPHPVPKPRRFLSRETTPDQQGMSDDLALSIPPQCSITTADEELADDGDSREQEKAESKKMEIWSSMTQLSTIVPNRCLANEIYRVTSPQGFCLIINIRKYKDCLKFEERLGSELDVKRVKDTFSKLDFLVRVHEDLSCNALAAVLSLAAISPELSDHGCFVCFIMAHGANSLIYGSDGVALEIQSITERFRGNQCEGLRNKPKLFFIQACRGMENSDAERGITIDQQVSDELGSHCPKDSDFLLSFATPSGQVSLRKETDGSPFVQTVCDVIEEHHATDHIIDILTTANGRLKSSPIYKGGLQMYVVSETQTRLSKKCYLNPEFASMFQV